VGYKVSMLLQIRNFGEEDAGVYMCTSTNSLGKIEGSIRLYQIGIYIDYTSRYITPVTKIKIITICTFFHAHFVLSGIFVPFPLFRGVGLLYVTFPSKIIILILFDVKLTKH
jgi:hypothetical protein